MCKLVAYISLNNEQLKNNQFSNIAKMFKHLLYINSYGNRDGTGVMLMEDDGKAYYYKRGLPSPDFIQLDTAKSLLDIDSRTRFLAGHTRYGTVGGTSDKNAHPFHHGNILLMQNGTSHYGYYNLVKSKQGPKEIEVDSEHVCWAISQQGYSKTFEEYEGAGVFMWLDIGRKTFNVVKNEERDLYICQLFNADVYMITTDKYALEYAAHRAGVTVSNVVPVKNDQLISFTIDGKVMHDHSVKVESEGYSYGKWNNNVGAAEKKSQTNTVSATSGSGSNILVDSEVDKYVGACCCCGNPVFDNEDFSMYDSGNGKEYLCEDCSDWAPEAFGLDNVVSKEALV